jgi:DNA-binding transcriptional MerR regulator
MQEEGIDDEKRYYSMGEVSAMFDVNASLIRFWEKEFDILKPKKNKKGNRLFTPKDVQNLKLIHHLVKERGFTLKGAMAKLKANKEDTAQVAEVISKLKMIKQALAEIRKEL